MRRLYLMRHGETLYLGRASADGSDLTPVGRQQIEVAAELLATVRLDRVVASPPSRAGPRLHQPDRFRRYREGPGPPGQLLRADALKEAQREPSSARLRRVLEARVRRPAGGPKNPLDSARPRD